MLQRNIVPYGARIRQYQYTMPHLVHSDALHFERPVESYWEQSADPLGLDLQPLSQNTTCDVAIIGGGFTGLSAAIELTQSGIDVCLLEAGPIAWGASGRNGGFACHGSYTLPLKKMTRTYGLDATKHYYKAMLESINCVSENCADFNIDAWQHGQGEVRLAHLPNRMDDFRDEQIYLRETFGDETTLLTKDALRQNGLAGPHFHGALKAQYGFGIHPLNYARGLARAAHKQGARLRPHSRITRWEQREGQHHLYTEQGQVTAKRVIVATNGYTPEDVASHMSGRILPAMSSIIVTRPLTEEEKAEQGWTSSMIAHDNRNLVHYFRLLPNNRFLFGGRGGTDSSNDTLMSIRQKLTTTFQSLFPAWRAAEVTHFWRGFVCLAYDGVPYVGTLDDHKTVWTAIAYHGNGVAMASWSGRALARLMTGKTSEKELPAVLTRRLAKFPLPKFRPLYLKGAYVWLGWQDSR
jgi:glycine/D-amino acid oxidase-like deaminating enzyme